MTIQPPAWLLFVILPMLVSCNKQQPDQFQPQKITTATCATYLQAPVLKGNTTTAIASEKYIWPNNSNGPIVIRVKFLQGGSNYLHTKVQRYAKEWQIHANVKFDFVSKQSPAEVRISFDQEADTYVWAIGTYLLDLTNDAIYNMHYANLKDSSSDEEIAGTVLHEFGHVLGLMHEQYHPQVRWNKPYIYGYYKRKKGWSKHEVDAQLFGFQIADPIHSTYDPQSIMHDWYPKNFILAGNLPVATNSLSLRDKEFIQQLYPFPKKRNQPL